MTATKANDIRCSSFSQKDRLFLDANIWLFVYGPLAYNPNKSRIYSNALRDIRRVGCQIFLDVVVLSEFINAFARLEYNQASPRPATFKAFRQTAAFKGIAKNIASTARRILKQCKRCDSNFVKADISAILTEYETGNLDFNDLIIAEICKQKALTLLTDDADFKGEDLIILTANNRLLTS